MVRSSKFQTLDHLLSTVGSRKVTVRVDSELKAESSVDLAGYNLAFHFQRNGSLNVASGKVVSGLVLANDPSWQIFTGSGTVSGMSSTSPRYWGTGATAVQSAINAANRDVYFDAITYSMGTTPIVITGKSNLMLHGTQATELTWTDSAMIGILVTGASHRVYIDGIKLNTANTANPLITLLKFTGNSAYARVTRCEFSGAKYAVYLAQTYIVKLSENDYAGCENYVYSTAAEGSNTDVLIQGETFGTTNIGTTSAVYISGVQNRLVGCYFETVATAAKWSVEAATGAQQIGVTGCQFANSGGVIAKTSTTVNISGNTFYDCDNTANAYVIRVDGGATGVITGNSIDNPTLGSVWGIGASGTVTVTGNFINKCAVGASIPAGSIMGNTITGCTTGIQLSSGSTGVVCGLNHLSGNATDINNAAGTNIVALNYASAISESASSGTYFGNSPKRAYVREVFGSTTWNPGTVNSGTTMSTTVTVSGAVVGDYFTCSFSNSLSGLVLAGYISAADTATVVLTNQTGSPVSIASGTLRCVARKSQ